MEGLKRILKTKQDVFLYTGSGHARLGGLPGQPALAGRHHPGAGERAFLAVLGAAWRPTSASRCGPSPPTGAAASTWPRVRAALAADTGHVIKAVGVVHNETSTGMTIPIPEVRAALDAAGHPALLLADTISSLG